jgi:hypothetical protein
MTSVNDNSSPLPVDGAKRKQGTDLFLCFAWSRFVSLCGYFSSKGLRLTGDSKIS